GRRCRFSTPTTRCGNSDPGTTPTPLRTFGETSWQAPRRSPSCRRTGRGGRPGAPRAIGYPSTSTGACTLGSAPSPPGARPAPFARVPARLAAPLARRGAGRDVVVGAVVSAREEPALEHVIGFVANTVVLRVNVAEGVSWSDLIEHIRAADLRALTHQQV